LKPITIGTSESGSVSIDIPKLIDTRAFIQANSGGGKSWLLRKLAEQAISRVQVIVLDPEGEFATLREKHDLILAGREGEVPTDPRAAGLLARKLAELNVSAVVDLYDLAPPERRRFVRLFLESLVEVPKALYHPMIVMLDEAHMFCPERSSGEAESTQAVINLLALGRKRGMCGILATQRLSKLHKDAEAECNNVFIGRTVQDIDQARAAKVLGFARGQDQLQLRDLEGGDFFAFGPAISGSGITRMHVGAVETTHPTAGKRHQLVPPKASDAVKQLVAGLADLPKQAQEEAKTLAEAHKQIADLRRQLKTAPKPQTVEVASKQELATIRSLRKGLEDAMKVIANVTATGFDGTAVNEEQIKTAVQAAVAQIVKMVETDQARKSAQFEKLKREANSLLARLHKVKHNEPFTVARTAGSRADAPATSVSPTNSTDLPDGEFKILTAAAQYPSGATREQLSILTGYKRSSRDTYVQRLRGRGFVEASADVITATPAGVEALGPDFAPLPTGTALQRYWLDRLPEGEKKILQILVDAGGEAVSRESVSDATGYKRSSRDTYIQRLGARRLVDSVGRGDVRAAGLLFEE
jgi:hypothetical protein